MNIKTNIFIVALFLVAINVFGQIDSLENQKIYSWKLNPYDLSIQLVEVDTSLSSIQNYNPLLKKTISSNYLGNLGSAAQSKLYYDRKKYKTGFIFSEPYAMYFHLPKDQLYFNTKRQFTLFKYSNAGPKNEAEQVLGVLHTQNVNKDFNFGFDFDMISSDGRYQNQELKQNKITIFSSYQKKGYRLHTNMGLNRLKAQENGGIDSIHYLNEDEFDNRLNIPVKLNEARAEVFNTKFYLVHEYRFGKTIEEIKVVEKKNNFEKGFNKNKINSIGDKGKDLTDAKLKGVDSISVIINDTTLILSQSDSMQIENNSFADTLGENQKIEVDTIKVLKLNGLSISHEMRYSKNSREFFDNNLSEAFYNDKEMFIDSIKTQDKVSQKLFGNKVSFHFRYFDKFSARLSFYDEQMTYGYNDTLISTSSVNPDQDTIIRKETEQKFSNGNVSIFLKTILFNHVIFSGYGEYYIYGNKKENSKVDLKFAYKLWSNTEISLEGKYSNSRPNYFYENFSSNNFIWKNDHLWRVEEWDAGFAIRNNKHNFYAKIRYGQISNHIFLDSTANVNQVDGQINIISGELSKKIVLGRINSITKFVYQQSTNQSVLSLPKYNLYQSLYYERLTHFKATGGKLLWQFGVDYRYTSKYMADGYMPTTGLFYRQFSHEQLDYHCFDIYINVTIKRLRFYLKYDYINSMINKNYYFTGPYYPSPEPLLKFGLAWTFYD
ncbi:MAG: hypothetical protein QM503_14585 [Bacteroidota bacterium]